jgi:hypothetical protein
MFHHLPLLQMSLMCHLFQQDPFPHYYRKNRYFPRNLQYLKFLHHWFRKNHLSQMYQKYLHQMFPNYQKLLYQMFLKSPLFPGDLADQHQLIL